MENVSWGPKIAKAIVAVMGDIDNIEKNLKVGTGNASYAGVSDKDVKVTFRKSFVKNGLCIIPTAIDEKVRVDRWEVEETWNGKTSKKMKQSVFTEVNTKYLLLHESGESIQFAGYGQGIDAQDKGAGKALTYALKNALLYIGLVPTGDIDDSDKIHSQDLPVPAAIPSKPWLNKGSKTWDSVIDKIYLKERTLGGVLEKFLISDEDQAEIKKIVLERSNAATQPQAVAQ